MTTAQSLDRSTTTDWVRGAPGAARAEARAPWRPAPRSSPWAATPAAACDSRRPTAASWAKAELRLRLAVGPRALLLLARHPGVPREERERRRGGDARHARVGPAGLHDNSRVDRAKLGRWIDANDDVGKFLTRLEVSGGVSGGMPGRFRRNGGSPFVRSKVGMPLAGWRVGVPVEYDVAECSNEVRAAWSETCELLERLGASVTPVSLPSTAAALAAYYVLAPAEASSNLARYDGVRYGRNGAVNGGYGTARDGEWDDVRQRGSNRVLRGVFVASGGERVFTSPPRRLDPAVSAPRSNGACSSARTSSAPTSRRGTSTGRGGFGASSPRSSLASSPAAVAEAPGARGRKRRVRTERSRAGDRAHRGGPASHPDRADGGASAVRTGRGGRGRSIRV